MFAKTFLFILAALFTMLLTGCVTKPLATVRFDPYAPTAASFQKCGTLYLSGVKDKRPNKRLVGKILKKGKTVSKIETTQNMERWFTQALTEALKREGCTITSKNTYQEKIARVYLRIDRIEAILDQDRLMGENLTASVYVTLFIRQGKSERIIKKIGLTQKKWVPPIGSESMIRAYLQETLNQVVNMIVEHIDTYRF